MDLPSLRVQLARDNIGYEILLYAGGSRNVTGSSANSEQVKPKSIPTQFQQKTYEKDNGCVWLSACPLVDSVDRDNADKMAQCYGKYQEKYEWLDVFSRKKVKFNNYDYEKIIFVSTTSYRSRKSV